LLDLGVSQAGEAPDPLVDWAYLDGALLTKNDCFRGTTIVDGKLTLSFPA
jgi:hypothetical protein